MAFTPSRLAYNNLLIGSSVVITSSADATGYPVSNLASSARYLKWRSSTTTGDQWILFDLGSNQSFQLLALTDVLLHTGGGTLKMQANATNAWGGPTVNDTVSLASPDLTHVVADWLSASQSLRWVRFLFTNVGLTSSYVEVGVAWCGPYFQPALSISPGAGFKRIDQSVERRAIGGQRSTVVRPKYHVVQGAFGLQTASDRESWRAAFDNNGASVPAVFGLIPGTASMTFYGTMAPEHDVTHHPTSADLWDVPFTFTEDVP